MAKKNKNTTTTKKTKGIDLEAFGEQANNSSRHFIAVLGDAIITLPKIREATQEAADKKAFKILDSLYDAFVTAQTDAIKCAVANICDGLGLGKPFYPLAN
jgi:hypothetical protein